MACFLAKTDPATYDITRLEADQATVWDGVTNPQAVNAIKSMKKGDTVLIYHSGGESAIVGVAKVTSSPHPDPNTPKSWVVGFKYAGRVEPPVTLKEIRETGEFDDWALIRQGRLSTMAVPEEFLAWLKKARSRMKL